MTQVIVHPNVVSKLKEQYRCPIWITIDGELIPISIMTDSRIRNCLNHIRNRIATECVSIYSYPLPNGEMAQELYYSDNPEDLEDAAYGLREFLRTWEGDLMDEATRRGLMV